jgi:isopentenyldiphosphate isomerase
VCITVSLFKPGFHEVYVIAENILEVSDAAYTSFELTMGIFNWTVTALSPWIKEDPSE